MPLHRLFGAFTDQVEVYASGEFYQRGKDLERDFRAMKVKIGRLTSPARISAGYSTSELCVVTPEEDISHVAAVRKALGSIRRLMVDANCVWSPATASGWAGRWNLIICSSWRGR
jgi:L-alanine-DL-glutamate epimerase-like enolase superfamily enzyme